MILVSNCPAAPTKGSPCASSSAPGASPTNINSASILPTPNTTFLREDARCEHFTQASARACNAANAAALLAAGCWLLVTATVGTSIFVSTFTAGALGIGALGGTLAIGDGTLFTGIANARKVSG